MADDNTQTINFNEDRFEATKEWVDGWKPLGYYTEDDPNGAYLKGQPKPPASGTREGYLWYAQAMQQWNYEQQNKFDWVQDFLYPGIVFTGQLALEKDRYGLYKEEKNDVQHDMQVSIDSFCGCMDLALGKWEENKPLTPQAAEYIPVNCCDTYRNTIICNLENMGKSQEYIEALDRFHVRQQIARQVMVDMKYEEKAKDVSCVIADMINGELPMSDLMENASDSCGRALYTASIGGACRSRRMDLGISELRLKVAGMEQERLERESLNRIAPVDKLGDLRTMMKDPRFAMQWALEQAQLIQNSLQNKYNLEAIIDPTIAERMAAQLAKCQAKLAAGLGRANISTNYFPNYNQFAQPFIHGVAGGLTDLFGNLSFGGRQVRNDAYRQPSHAPHPSSPVPTVHYGK